MHSHGASQPVTFARARRGLLRPQAWIAFSFVCIASLFSWDGQPRAARSKAGEGANFADYAVASDNVEASEAGAKILAQGGNAADAAAATMLALGVASPSSSGLGGGGFVLYYRASDRSLTFLDFRERAPALATPDMFAKKPGDTPEQADERSRSGGLAVAVPGEPMGIAQLVARFGKLPLSEIVKPAHALAKDGFAFTEHTRRVFAYVGNGFLRDPLAAKLFKDNPPAGTRIQNEALAKTLATLGSQGDKPFYRGAIAQEIVRSVKARGGNLSAADLSSYSVIERKPLTGTRLGYEWVTAPLPSAGGYTMLTSLALLERWLETPAHWRGTERYHALIESWKGPYLDRQNYLGDSDVVQVPLAELSTEARMAQRAARYHPLLAAPAEAYVQPLAQVPTGAQQPDNPGTSHLCVVDREGNIAAVTTTVNLAFGARVSAAGMWLNDEMDDFASEVGEPNAFGLGGGASNLPGPGKRPLSSMTPTIVFKGGKPVLCVGGSGGSRIITAVEQVALGVLVDGLHPGRAVVAPRLHHQAVPVTVDARDLPQAQYDELVLRGHKMRQMGFSAHVQAIAIGEPGPEHLKAASDPQKGGEPRGL
jgi:gamma-glutamyltranspeptidase/glutathione hydrolase